MLRYLYLCLSVQLDYVNHEQGHEEYCQGGSYIS